MSLDIPDEPLRAGRQMAGSGWHRQVEILDRMSLPIPAVATVAGPDLRWELGREFMGGLWLLGAGLEAGAPVSLQGGPGLADAGSRVRFRGRIETLEPLTAWNRPFLRLGLRLPWGGGSRTLPLWVPERLGGGLKAGSWVQGEAQARVESGTTVVPDLRRC